MRQKRQSHPLYFQDSRGVWLPKGRAFEAASWWSNWAEYRLGTACILLAAQVGKRQMGCRGDVFPEELQPWSSCIFALTFLRWGCCDVCHLRGPLWVTAPTPQHLGHGGRLFPLLSLIHGDTGVNGRSRAWPMHQLRESSGTRCDPTCVSPSGKNMFAFTHRQKAKTRKQNKPQKRCPITL